MRPLVFRNKHIVTKKDSQADFLKHQLQWLQSIEQDERMRCHHFDVKFNRHLARGGGHLGYVPSLNWGGGTDGAQYQKTLCGGIKFSCSPQLEGWLRPWFKNQVLSLMDMVLESLKPQVLRNNESMAVSAKQVMDITPIDDRNPQPRQEVSWIQARPLTQNPLNIDSALLNATEQPTEAQVQRARKEQRRLTNIVIADYVTWRRCGIPMFRKFLEYFSFYLNFVA